jgi:hypothetical protein
MTLTIFGIAIFAFGQVSRTFATVESSNANVECWGD